MLRVWNGSRDFAVLIQLPCNHQSSVVITRCEERCASRSQGTSKFRGANATLFWDQIARIYPESCAADNDYLTFMIANETLFASFAAAVEALR